MSGFNNEGFQPDSKDQNYNHKGNEEFGADSEGVKASELTDTQMRQERRRIAKNVVAISVAFMLLFTAYQSMANLQSSINKVDGLGQASLIAIYASLVLSCMFVPSYMIKKLTVKWTMVVSMLCYSTYILAQFYPEFYTLIPGALILGLGAAPMWSAKCTYLTQVGNKYGELVGQRVEPIIVKFFGIFFLFFQFSNVIGNIISSQILGTKPKTISKDELLECGTNYCPKWDKPANLSAAAAAEAAEDDNFSASPSQIYALAGTYLVCSLLSAVIIALVVDPLSRYGENDRDNSRNKMSGMELLIATMKHLKKPYQILIIPLTFWSGIEQGFFGADFTAGYVSCAYGVHNLGYVLIVYGLCDAVCSFSFGYVIKVVGRLPIFVAGAVVNVIAVIILYNWSPNPEEAHMFYIIAALWGAADAVWQTQINALYGVLFEKDEEAAFSNYRLWESLGFIVAYLFQIYTCIHLKLAVVLVVLTAGMAGYFTIEFVEWKKRPRNEA